MKKKRYTEDEIKRILQEYEEGATIQQIIKDYRISLATFYNWKAKFGRNILHDFYTIKKLKDENEHLKLMFANLTLENISLREKLKDQKQNYCKE